MLALILYLLVTLIPLAWLAIDNNAIAAFEIFKKHLHRTARDMGMYWEWLVQQLLRASLLISCVILGIVAATWMLRQNPWELGWLERTSLFAAMLIGSLALFAMPHLSANLRLKSFLYFKSAELMTLVSSVSSKEGIRQHLEPAKLDMFNGVDGWTAWHPLEEGWNGEPLWAGLTPVIYLHQDKETSLIVTVDFEHFLAWKLPRGSVTPGHPMPICPRCSVKTVSDLRGREGWSVVHADLDIEEAAA